MNIQTAKAIPIDELLQRLGYEVVKTVSGCKWYHSPGRSEKTPSFKLTRDANGWYDHGTGEGGNILNLAYRLQSGLPLQAQLDGNQVKQALAFIEQLVGSSLADNSPTRLPSLPPNNQPAYSVIDRQPFSVYGRGSALTKAALYLGSRGINAERVAPYLQDVTYTASDSKKRYGFGMPNVAGGYELRRLGDWAKTAVGPKDVTIFQAQRVASPWHTFYSMIDFLTFITVDQPPVGAYHYLIINSDSLVNKAISYLETIPAGFMIQYPHVDPSGQRANQKLLDFLTANDWGGGDRAYLYAGFKDWTEAREKQLGLTN